MSPAELDRRALIYARTHAHAALAERVIAAYSRTGEHAACWLALGAVGAIRAREPRRRRAWRQGIAIVAGAYALNYAIKLAVRRPRPELDRLPPLTATVSRLSFPSAHATTSFAAVRAYRGLVPGWWLHAAAAMFALSRPYLGVHYPSDVLGGALVGSAFGELCRRAASARAVGGR